MSLFPKKEDGGIDVKSMWEVKLLKAIWLFFIYIFFVMYLLLTIPTAWKWAQLKYYTANFEIEALDDTIIDLFDKGKGDLAMDLISSYGNENITQITETLGPSTSYLNANYFFYVSNIFYEQGDLDEALFWNTLAHFRMRYDVMRCNFETSDQFASGISELITRPALLAEMKKDPPESVARRLERTLAWDEQYPPKNSPEYACDLIRQLQGLQEVQVRREASWEAIRYLLRYNAAEYIADFKEAQDTDPATGEARE